MTRKWSNVISGITRNDNETTYCFLKWPSNDSRMTACTPLSFSHSECHSVIPMSFKDVLSKHEWQWNGGRRRGKSRLVYLEDIIRENSYTYQCEQKMDTGDQCDFSTRSKKDLKIHRKKYFECDIFHIQKSKWTLSQFSLKLFRADYSYNKRFSYKCFISTLGYFVLPYIIFCRKGSASNAIIWE